MVSQFILLAVKIKGLQLNYMFIDPFGQNLAATAHGLPATSRSKAVALSSSTFHMFNEIARAFRTCILNAKGITPPKMFYLVNVDTRSQCLMSGRETRDEHALLRRYLPEVELAPICGSAKPTLDTKIAMQYFGVLIYLLSNNLMEAEERNNIVRLLRDHKQLRDHFRHLLSHKHPTSFAVAENLFLDAVTNDNLDLVELLLEAGADPNSSLPYVSSALSQAIRCNNIAMVQLLLKYGADVNARGHGDEGRSPFQAALFDRAHMEIVSILIKAGPYINDEALQIAIWGDDIAATIFLLFYGADVDTLSTSSKTALLCLAVKNGAVDLVEYALLHGADANHYMDHSEQARYAFKFGGRNYQGISAMFDRWNEMMPYRWRSSPQTAFQVAINCADIKIIQLLIQNGADVNQQHIRPYKHTALDLALKRGDVDIITLIKQFSAHIGSVSISAAPLDVIDAHDHSEAPLGAALVAAIRKADVQMITSLIESGADINAEFSYWPRTTALSLAIETANAALVTFLLDNGVDILNQGSVALVNAVRIGYLKLIKLLLSRGVDFDRDGALKEAAGSRKIECLKLLLGHGADMGVMLSERHISNLFLAILGCMAFYPSQILEEWPGTQDRKARTDGIIQLIQLLLLEPNANINAHNPYLGCGVLLRAIKNVKVGRADIRLVQFLLDHGADPKARSVLERMTAIELAVHFIPLRDRKSIGVERAEEMVTLTRLLLRYDVDGASRALKNAIRSRRAEYDRLSQGNQDPEEKAVAMAFLSIVQLLLTHGADINGSGGVALESAVWRDDDQDETNPRHENRSSDVELVELLLSHGADASYLPTQAGRCTLIQSTLKAGSGPEEIEVVRLLLAAGADVNATSGQRYGTPLQLAAKRGTLDVIEFLLDHGADINAASPMEESGKTALQVAVDAGNFEVARLLLTRGADINTPASQAGGVTALQAAAIRGYLGIAVFLLDNSADVNAPGAIENGRTALEGAAEHGRLDMVQLLLNAGANVQGEDDSQYERAVGFAKDNGHWSVVRILSSWVVGHDT